MCIYRNVYLESPEFFAFLCHILTVFQPPIHFLGFYIIIWKTPSRMGRIKFSMLIMHSTCVFMDFTLTFLTTPYVIFPAAAGYPVGFLTMIGVPSSLQTYIGITAFLLIGPAIIIFFEDRYNQLVRLDFESTSRKLKRGFHFALLYLHSLLAILPAFFDTPTSEDAKSIFLSEFPCFPEEFVNNPSFFMLDEHPIIGLLCLSLLLISTAIQTTYFVSGTVSHLFSTKSTSRRTSDLQKRIFVKLCIQCFVPIGFIMIPAFCINVTAAIGYVDMILVNFSMAWIVLHGVVSTATMLTVHLEYRSATLQVFGIRKAPVITSFVVNTSVSIRS